jgi:hypothetical protein
MHRTRMVGRTGHGWGKIAEEATENAKSFGVEIKIEPMPAGREQYQAKRLFRCLMRWLLTILPGSGITSSVSRRGCRERMN